MNIHFYLVHKTMWDFEVIYQINVKWTNSIQDNTNFGCFAMYKKQPILNLLKLFPLDFF